MTEGRLTHGLGICTLTSTLGKLYGGLGFLNGFKGSGKLKMESISGKGLWVIGAAVGTGALLFALGLGVGAGVAEAATVTAGSGQSKAVYRTIGTGVVYMKPKTDVKTVSVPVAIKKSGKSYKVKGIAKNAFKGSKVKRLLVGSKKLSKRSVKGSLRGSNIKTVRVPYSVAKKYKEAFAKKNSGKSIKIYMRYKDKYLGINFPSSWIGNVRFSKNVGTANENRTYEWYFKGKKYKYCNSSEIFVGFARGGADLGGLYNSWRPKSSHYHYAQVGYLPKWSSLTAIAKGWFPKKNWRHGAKQRDIEYIAKSIKVY